jgi:hypothetical protein
LPRVLLALVSAFALIVMASNGAEATAKCVKVVSPKPCKGIKRCDWGGDPDGIFVELHTGTKRLARARTKAVLANVRRAGVRPRGLDVIAYRGKKRVLAKSYKIKGRHYSYSVNEDCWTVR